MWADVRPGRSDETVSRFSAERRGGPIAPRCALGRLLGRCARSFSRVNGDFYTDDGPGAPHPTKSIDCQIGEAQLSVRTYVAQTEVDNTSESAIQVQQILGGRVVEFSGCRQS
jgi:hypothetical protein